MYLNMYVLGSINSNVFYVPPRFLAFYILLIFTVTVAITNIRNMHAVSTNQIADILHFNDDRYYIFNLPRDLKI